MFGTAALFVWYFQSVDFAWVLENMFAHEQMSASQKEMAMKMVSKNALLVGSLAGALLAPLVLAALNAVYFVLLSKFQGWDFKFSQWFGFCAWSAVPALLLIPLGAIQIILASNGQLALNQINPVSLNQLFFHLEVGMPGASLLDTINLTTFWVLGLQTLGLAVWTGLSRAKSAFWACLPHVLVYAVWALVVLSKA